MIRMIQGQPGAGKTYFTMEKIVHALRRDDRPIITNMDEIVLPDLNDYLHELDGDNAPDVLARLKIIPKADTAYFFRHRSGGLLLPEPAEKDSRTGKKLPYDEFREAMKGYFHALYDSPATAGGCVYFIDEVHDYFSAREWTEVGRSALYYASKHRHLLDDVWLISQAPEQVEATLKRLASEFYELRNHYRESFGMFRKQGGFKWNAYYKLPSPTEKPFNNGTLRLDPKGIGRCYLTTGALGSKSRKPEKIEKSKKLPFWALPAFVVLCIMGIGALIASMPFLANTAVGAVIKPAIKTTSEMSKSAPASGVQNSDTGVAVPPRTPASVVASPRQVVTQSAVSSVTVTGMVRRGNRMNVTLSDGRTVTERGPLAEDHPWDVVAVDRGYVTLRNGDRHYYRVPPPRAVVAPVLPKEVPKKEEPVTPPPSADYVEPRLMAPSPDINTMGFTPHRKT